MLTYLVRKWKSPGSGTISPRNGVFQLYFFEIKVHWAGFFKINILNQFFDVFEKNNNFD